MTTDREIEVIKLLSKCGIRRVHRKTSLPRMGKSGKQLRKYLGSAEYVSDYDDYMGVFLAGGTVEYPYMLPVFAKTEILMGNDGYFIHLPNLAEIVFTATDGKKMERIVNVRNLYIGMFQSEYTNPYTSYQVFSIMRILMTRLETSSRTSFSSCRNLQHCDWWPPELLAMIREKVEEFDIQSGPDSI